MLIKLLHLKQKIIVLKILFQVLLFFISLNNLKIKPCFNSFVIFDSYQEELENILVRMCI